MSLQKFSDALVIFSKYCKDSMNEKYKMGADHDIIYIYVSQEELQPDSEDGKKLEELGWQPHDGGNWAYSV